MGESGVLKLSTINKLMLIWVFKSSNKFFWELNMTEQVSME